MDIYHLLVSREDCRRVHELWPRNLPNPRLPDTGSHWTVEGEQHDEIDDDDGNPADEGSSESDGSEDDASYRYPDPRSFDFRLGYWLFELQMELDWMENGRNPVGWMGRMLPPIEAVPMALAWVQSSPAPSPPPKAHHLKYARWENRQTAVDHLQTALEAAMRLVYGWHVELPKLPGHELEPPLSTAG